MKKSLLLLCLPLLFSACSGNSHKHHSGNSLIYSPNGVPLTGGPLGYSTCDAAMSRWLGNTDTNHDNSIDNTEFMADAEAQFKRMDIDGNGYLLSEELERFRQPYHSYSRADDNSTNGNKQSRHHKHGDNKDNTDETFDVADPVMSADTDLDFRVTHEEFIVHAQKIFGELDSDHNNLLSHDEVLAKCHTK